jgi:elongation factor P--beta-lysine ligase
MSSACALSRTTASVPRGLPQQPIDNNLLAALEAGLPDCSGVRWALIAW